MFSAQTADSLFVIRELYPSFRSFACIVAIPRGKAADAELMCGVQVVWTDWDDRAMFVTGKQGERERRWGSRGEMKWLIVSFLSSLCSQGPLSSIRAVIKRSEYSLSQMNIEPRRMKQNVHSVWSEADTSCTLDSRFLKVPTFHPLIFLRALTLKINHSFKDRVVFLVCYCTKKIKISWFWRGRVGVIHFFFF